MKKILSIIFLCILNYVSVAQASLQPLLPQVGLFQQNQLWNIIAINNAGNAQQCYITLSLQDRQSGIEVMSATTSIFTLPKGSKQLNNANLAPIQYATFSRSNNFLPVGSYTACYKLMGTAHAEGEITEACSSFDVAPLSPPMLIMPADSSVLQVAPSQFSWQPPTPISMFQQLHYELLIAEILPGQHPEEAVELNAPVYINLNIASNFLNYAGAYPSFERGKWYAWQVVAQDGQSYAAKTSVWDFKVDTNTIQLNSTTILPYATLKRTLEAGAVACKGDLRVEYNNEVADKKITYKITTLDNANNKIIKIAVLELQPGKNFIDIKLDKQFDINKTYLFQLNNSRSENWSVKFFNTK